MACMLLYVQTDSPICCDNQHGRLCGVDLHLRVNSDIQNQKFQSLHICV
jgi:hypothetical protein